MPTAIKEYFDAEDDDVEINITNYKQKDVFFHKQTSKPLLPEGLQKWLSVDDDKSIPRETNLREHSFMICGNDSERAAFVRAGLERFVRGEEIPIIPRYLERYRKRPEINDLLMNEIQRRARNPNEPFMQYIHMMKLLRSGQIDDVDEVIELLGLNRGDLERTIKQCREEGFFGYTVELYNGLSFYRNPRESLNGIFGDAQYQMILKRNGIFVANIGFDPITSGVIVKQIQGVPGKEDDLRAIKWSRALLKMVVDWAKEHRIPKILIQSYKTSKWYTVKEQRNGNARLLYDVTAQREGFVYNSQTKRYEMELEPDSLEKSYLEVCAAELKCH